jgi:spore maturation protein CgeB
VKLLLLHPGASISTADVEAGLRLGLERHGVEVIQYRLDGRIETAHRYLHTAARLARKSNPDIPKPTPADVLYQACIGVIEKALRHQVDAVLIVSAMYVHPDILILMRRAGLLVTVLFTESPYDIRKELSVAKLVDGCWTNERAVLDEFIAANPNSGYIPHAWHPERHQAGPQPEDEQVPAHDVVFVGSAFPERIRWFQQVDWTGIDLGLYGAWEALGSRSPLRHFVRGSYTDNATSAALYRRAKIGLNLYRTSSWNRQPSMRPAESLNPRAYELAACGAFHLSDYRAEVAEVFGDLVPTFTSPHQCASLIRSWLADPAGRQRVASQLPACVAESSWLHRASRVIGDLQSLVLQRAQTRSHARAQVSRQAGSGVPLDHWCGSSITSAAHRVDAEHDDGQNRSHVLR